MKFGSWGRRFVISPTTREVSVFVAEFSHAYNRRLADLFSARYPNVVHRAWPSPSWRILLAPRPTVIHMNWASGRGVLRTTTLILGLALAKVSGISIVWTVHNPLGKSRRNRRSEALVRWALTVLCNQLILLNDGAIPVFLHETPRALRRMARNKARVVPHPRRHVDHGATMSKASARSALGIDPDQPVVAYLPATNQPYLAGELADPDRRYALLYIDRCAKGGRLEADVSGWRYLGRPDDAQYGLLVCASDAVLLTDGKAFGSGTLQTAADLRRPVISPRCPATEELVALGGGCDVVGELTPDSIAKAVESVQSISHGAFRTFARAHDDGRVAEALAGAYRAAGVPLTPIRATHARPS